jgi:hypothetical protein
MRKQFLASALAAAVGAGSIITGLAQPAAARNKSRENAWRIGTYAGAAGTAYALSQGKGTWALIGAGATLLSYTQWKKEIQRRHHRRGSYADYQRYRSNWYRHHRHHRHH